MYCKIPELTARITVKLTHIFFDIAICLISPSRQKISNMCRSYWTLWWEKQVWRTWEYHIKTPLETPLPCLIPLTHPLAFCSGQYGDNLGRGVSHPQPKYCLVFGLDSGQWLSPICQSLRRYFYTRSVTRHQPVIMIAPSRNPLSWIQAWEAVLQLWYFK